MAAWVTREYGRPAVLKAAPALLVLLLAACASAPQPAPASDARTPPPAPRPPPSAPITDEGAPPPLPGAPSGLGVPAPTEVKRLDFRGGEPQVPIRLMEGRPDVAFSPRGRMRLRFGGPDDKVLEAPAGSVWKVRVTQGQPAVFTARIQLGEFRFSDKAGLAEEQQEWQARGLFTRVQIIGSLYGIAGKVIDNRRYLLLLDEAFSLKDAAARQAELLRQFGVRTTLFEEIHTPARGILEVRDSAGTVVGLAQDSLTADTLDASGFEVRQVEYHVGYENHGFEDRSYRGALQLTVDRFGTLAVVNVVKLEDLLKGLVPSEIFARAHMEALKAQAVTARGEVLAKVGTKHLADPYLLCSEQHCAVYRGRTGEAASTTAAVEATRGEALFSKDGRLVDSVYSAVCGGHTENNEVVWGGPPDPSLRGQPDLLEPSAGQPSPQDLEAFLAATDLPAACRLSTLTQPNKFRWEKRFTAAQVNAFTESLGVGPVHAMKFSERGVSGRARVLTISGELGATQIRGELNIRKLFGMLNSSMAVVEPTVDGEGHITGWVFRGGGWGHGVGMCQTGAIGRAEAGQRYRDILRHYYNGAEVAPIY